MNAPHVVNLSFDGVSPQSVQPKLKVSRTRSGVSNRARPPQKVPEQRQQTRNEKPINSHTSTFSTPSELHAKACRKVHLKHELGIGNVSAYGTIRNTKSAHSTQGQVAALIDRFRHGKPVPAHRRAAVSKKVHWESARCLPNGSSSEDEQLMDERDTTFVDAEYASSSTNRTQETGNDAQTISSFQTIEQFGGESVKHLKLQQGNDNNTKVSDDKTWRVHVFWDIENLQIPKTYSAFSTISSLRSEILTTMMAENLISQNDQFQVKFRISAYHSPTKGTLTKLRRSQLVTAGVSLVDIGKDKPGQADCLIKDHVGHCIDDFPPSSTILVLVSGDSDFLGSMRDAGEQGFRFVSIMMTDMNPSGHRRDPIVYEGFRSFAWKVLSWEHILSKALDKQSSIEESERKTKQTEQSLKVRNTESAKVSPDNAASRHEAHSDDRTETTSSFYVVVYGMKKNCTTERIRLHFANHDVKVESIWKAIGRKKSRFLVILPSREQYKLALEMNGEMLDSTRCLVQSGDACTLKTFDADFEPGQCEHRTATSQEVHLRNSRENEEIASSKGGCDLKENPTSIQNDTVNSDSKCTPKSAPPPPVNTVPQQRSTCHDSSTVTQMKPENANTSQSYVDVTYPRVSNEGLSTKGTLIGSGSKTPNNNEVHAVDSQQDTQNDQHKHHDTMPSAPSSRNSDKFTQNQGRNNAKQPFVPQNSAWNEQYKVNPDRDCCPVLPNPKSLHLSLRLYNSSEEKCRARRCRIRKSTSGDNLCSCKCCDRRYNLKDTKCCQNHNNTCSHKCNYDISPKRSLKSERKPNIEAVSQLPENVSRQNDSTDKQQIRRSSNSRNNNVAETLRSHILASISKQKTRTPSIKFREKYRTQTAINIRKVKEENFRLWLPSANTMATEMAFIREISNMRSMASNIAANW